MDEPAVIVGRVTLIDTDALPFRDLDFTITPTELRSQATLNHHYIAELLNGKPRDETSSDGGTLNQNLPVLALSYPY